MPKTSREEARKEAVPPKEATLAKYGLTRDAWLAILSRQGGVCAVCKKLPSSGRLCTDHEHVLGWKKLSPERRALYVRGLLCYFCNHYYVGRSITVQKARNVVEYLQAYSARLAGRISKERRIPSGSQRVRLRSAKRRDGRARRP